ncbi:hypothetical protein [Roseibacillus persicicus]|uniref:hypothetical protein n=1 Tax=Roseibacillus persicicus TaxID=454148 RepID=UPI00280CC790|nr:hypothetical protein [Roseibacillus persicicus]MDQ8192639.1 hypothetical protein [Roseibacillus persicicus]
MNLKNKWLLCGSLVLLALVCVMYFQLTSKDLTSQGLRGDVHTNVSFKSPPVLRDSDAKASASVDRRVNERNKKNLFESLYSDLTSDYESDVDVSEIFSQFRSQVLFSHQNRTKDEFFSDLILIERMVELGLIEKKWEFVYIKSHSRFFPNEVYQVSCFEENHEAADLLSGVMEYHPQFVAERLLDDSFSDDVFGTLFQLWVQNSSYEAAEWISNLKSNRREKVIGIEIIIKYLKEKKSYSEAKEWEMFSSAN